MSIRLNYTGSLKLWPDRWFAYCALIMVVLLFATYWIVGHPILDQDTRRYLPGDIPGIDGWRYGRVPWHGSVIPQFVNYLPVKLFGHAGVVSINILLISYSLAHLFSSIRRYLHPRKPLLFLFFYCFSLLLLSFTPILAVSIVSEPLTLACFALIFSITIANGLNIIDAGILFTFSAYHPSNIPVFLVSLGIIFLLNLTRSRSISTIPLVLCLLILSSNMLDKLLYHEFGEDRTRIQASFIGAIIINYYPFVLESACQDRPEMKICAQQVRDFIAANRRPLVYQPGRFLWGGSRIFIDSDKVPDNYQTSPLIMLSEFESTSRFLMQKFILLSGYYGLEYFRISLIRISALFNQNRIVNFNFRSNINLGLPQTQMSFLFTDNKIFFDLCTFIKTSQLILIVILLFVHWGLRHQSRLRKFPSKIISTGLLLYFSNLAFMGVAATAVTRYHYRAFFILTVLILVLLWELIEKLSHPLTNRYFSRSG